MEELVEQWGKIAARWFDGDAGPGLDVDFEEMEQIAATRGSRGERSNTSPGGTSDD